MINLFLAPKSNKQAIANFEATVLQGCNLKDIEPYLSEDQKGAISNKSNVKIWGTKDAKKSHWEKMQPNDVVLFYNSGIFEFSCTVLLTLYSPELGKKLWPPDAKGNYWNCIFIVTDLKPISIPFTVVRSLARYEPTMDKVQGFMRMDSDRAAAILTNFGSLETFISQEPKVYTIIESVLEEQENEHLIEERLEETNKEKLLAEALAYKPSGINHVIKNEDVKKRVENKKQKKLVAALEDYSCQICGWSQEWINKKKKVMYIIDVDHILEKAYDGDEQPDNLWALCPNCHAKKTYGVITVDVNNGTVFEGQTPVKLHHNYHLRWLKTTTD